MKSLWKAVVRRNASMTEEERDEIARLYEKWGGPPMLEPESLDEAWRVTFTPPLRDYTKQERRFLRALVKDIIDATGAKQIGDSVELVTCSRREARWAYVTMCMVIESGFARYPKALDFLYVAVLMEHEIGKHWAAETVVSIRKT